MRLEWIEIKGFKEKERLIKLKFSNELASVIYGENGCGKTSLLRTIHAIFTKDEDILLKENVQEIKLSVFDEENINIIINISKNLTEYKDDNCNNYILKGRYDWEEFDNSRLKEISSILFGVNRGITVKSEVLPEHIEKYFMTVGRKNRELIGHNLWSICEDLAIYLNRYNSRRLLISRRTNQLYRKNSLLDKIDMNVIEDLIYRTYKEAQIRRTESVKSILVETLSYVIYPSENEFNNIEEIPDNFPELLQNNREKLLEVLSLNNDDLFQKNIIKILRQNDIEKIIKECVNNNILLNLLIRMINILKFDSEFDVITRLTDIFNSQINSKKKLIVNDNGVFIEFDNSQNNHGIEMLSSGEKQLLTLLSVLIVEGNKRDIIMVDEPELSLNLKWQREIIDIFREIAPNTQIIFASHSSAVSRKNTKYLVKMS